MIPDAVLFDFDGTLADSLDLAVHVVNDLALRYGFKPITREQTRTTGTRQLLRNAGLKLYHVPKFLIEARRVMGRGMADVDLFPHVKDLIVSLRERDIRLGIVSSNSADNVRAVLTKSKLAGHFEHIVTGSSMFGKHRLIANLIKKMHLNPDRIVFVGDETRDVEACERIALKNIAVDWGFHDRRLLVDVGADVVSTVADLKSHLLPAAPRVTDTTPS